MLQDFSSCFSKSSSEPELVSLRPLLLLLDRLRGNTERAWSMKDSLELGFRDPGCRREVVGGVVVMPKRVLTSNELLNPDKNGDKLPPKVATNAAY